MEFDSLVGQWGTGNYGILLPTANTVLLLFCCGFYLQK